jgi:hypothetical protein
MIPTRLSPASGAQVNPVAAGAQMKPGQVEVESLQLIDQLSEEMLLTVQAFQRLHASLQNRMLGK